jgi:GT2 family glycosyltransferase
MPEPVYGVVLLNWNGFSDTEAALDSLATATPPPRYVVIVDNGSADDSVARLREWIADHTTEPLADARRSEPEFELIAESANRGFAVGNNIGLAALALKDDITHFLLLNNDATVAPDYFACMSAAIRNTPDAALLGCTIFYHPERDRVWFGGGYEVPHRALMLHHYRVPANPDPHDTVFVTGCAMVISRQLYDSRGGLAECYSPIYWEDTEYSFRARENGWRVMLVPSAHVYHKVSASMGGEVTTPRAAYWQNRNRGYYVRRNYRGSDRVIALAYLVVTKPARSLVELARGRVAMSSAIMRGFLHGLLDDPA